MACMQEFCLAVNNTSSQHQKLSNHPDSGELHDDKRSCLKCRGTVRSKCRLRLRNTMRKRETKVLLKELLDVRASYVVHLFQLNHTKDLQIHLSVRPPGEKSGAVSVHEWTGNGHGDAQPYPDTNSEPHPRAKAHGTPYTYYASRYANHNESKHQSSSRAKDDVHG